MAITVNDVQGWTRDSGSDPDALALVVAAVNSLVATLPAVPADGVWPDHVRAGAVMLAARLYRRRNSPNGIETIDALGTTYVTRYDADIARMLRLSMPVVG